MVKEDAGCVSEKGNTCTWVSTQGHQRKEPWMMFVTEDTKQMLEAVRCTKGRKEHTKRNETENQDGEPTQGEGEGVD